MKENLMKNFKLFSVLFITILLVTSSTHAVGNDPLEITDISHGVPFDGISDTELFAIAQEAGVPVLDESGEQSVGAFAGGRGKKKEKKLEEKKFKCDECNKRFDFKSKLEIHLRTHTGEKPFWCDFCDKRFSETWNLKRHILTHTDQKRFQCKTCNKRFTQNSSLKTHMIIHSGKKQFQCPTCGKSFQLNSGLVNHLRIHTGEKPFKCETCGMAFNRNNNLKRHLRMHSKKI